MVFWSETAFALDHAWWQVHSMFDHTLGKYSQKRTSNSASESSNSDGLNVSDVREQYSERDRWQMSFIIIKFCLDTL